MTCSDSYTYMILATERIVQIVYNEKTDWIWEWHFTYLFYLHNCCYDKEMYIQPFADIF